MAEYIARAAAIVDFERCNNENPVWTPQRVKTLLMRIPTADVEPVVRCRDCRYYDPEDWGGITCKADGGMTDPDEDSFCSQGERRTDNGKAVDKE